MNGRLMMGKVFVRSKVIPVLKDDLVEGEDPFDWYEVPGEYGEDRATMLNTMNQNRENIGLSAFGYFGSRFHAAYCVDKQVVVQVFAGEKLGQVLGTQRGFLR